MAKPVARTAIVAGYRLGMEPAIRGIVILLAAVSVHVPMADRGSIAIVGQAQDHRIARAAIGAIDVRVAIAAGDGIEQLRQTVIADGEVGGDSGARLSALKAFTNGELFEPAGVDVAHFNIGNGGRR